MSVQNRSRVIKRTRMIEMNVCDGGFVLKLDLSEFESGIKMYTTNLYPRTLEEAIVYIRKYFKGEI